MSKTLFIIVIFVVLVIAVVFFSRQQTIAPTLSGSPTVSPSLSPSPTATITPAKSATPTPTAVSTSPPQATSTPKAATHTIKYLANGAVNLSTLTIKVGDKVTFFNESSAPRWPASGVHPTHQICQGFDALRGLLTGESYTYTFTEAKTCPFHDHLDAGNSSLRGQIIVNP